MLKFVLIGIGIIIFAVIIIINLWSFIAVRKKYLVESERLFQKLNDYKESTSKINDSKNERRKLLLIGILCSLLIVAICCAYFPTTKMVFKKHHEHIYLNTVNKEPTCVEEGTMNYKCKYCDKCYEEPIALIDHKYQESSRQEPTCVQEGSITYTCSMCNASYGEPIAIIEHTYIESERQEPDCTNAGYIKYFCQGCGGGKTEQLSTNGNHHYKIVSFSKTSFFKSGYNRCVCEQCGDTYYSLKINLWNWVCILSILVLIVAIVIVIYVRVDEMRWFRFFRNPMAWVGIVLGVLSASVLVSHIIIALPNQPTGLKWYDKKANTPEECQLVEVGRTESNYTENGTITYKDQNAGKEYIEYLPLKEINVQEIPQYVEKDYSNITACAEHTSVTQCFTKTPTCVEDGELVTMCNVCGTIISTDKIESFGHNWNDWTIEKEPSATHLGEKSRECTICAEKQTSSIFTYAWVIPLAIVELAILIIGTYYFFRKE